MAGAKLCERPRRFGGGPRVVVSTAAFHARVRVRFPGFGGPKGNKNVSSPSTPKTQYCGEPLWPRGSIGYSASDLQGSNFESCVWRAVSSHSSHHPQEVLLVQFSLYVHKSGLTPDSFHFIFKAAASSDGLFDPVVAGNSEVRIPAGSDICQRGCAYTVLQTVQRPGVYSAVYNTVRYKEPLTSVDKSTGIFPAAGFLLSQYCYYCAESDVKQNSQTSRPVTASLE